MGLAGCDFFCCVESGVITFRTYHNGFAAHGDARARAEQLAQFTELTRSGRREAVLCSLRHHCCIAQKLTFSRPRTNPNAKKYQSAVLFSVVNWLQQG
jgi:hypothetical protein